MVLNNIKMSKKAKILYFVLPFFFGAGCGFLFAPELLDILIQPEVNKISTISTNFSEFLFIRVVFSFLVGVSFISIPLSGLVACNFPNLGRYPIWVLFFTVVMTVSAVALTLYYRQYFSDMSTAINISEFTSALDKAGMSTAENINIAIEKVPFYKIPLISSGTCVALALLILGLRKLKRAN